MKGELKLNRTRLVRRDAATASTQETRCRSDGAVSRPGMRYFQVSRSWKLKKIKMQSDPCRGFLHWGKDDDCVAIAAPGLLEKNRIV